MILIKNGHIVDPVTETDAVKDVLIAGKKILSIEDTITPEDTKKYIGEAITDTDLTVIDADGLTIAPGLVDAHVHFRDPGFTYKEDIITGAAAAARGGVTTVICMANTKPPVDNAETLHYIQKKGEETDINVLQTATVTKGMQGKELVDMELLASEGAAGFTDDGLPIMDSEVLASALRKARELDLPVSLHEEDKRLITENGINGGGKAAEALGLTGSPREAEYTLIERDVEIAASLDAPLCIQHISTAEGVDYVRKVRAAHPCIHAEATPHHFSLTEDAVITKGTADADKL